MSASALARVLIAQIACEEKAVLSYIADCAGGDDDFGIEPDIDPAKAAQYAGLPLSRTKQILEGFSSKGVLFPRQRDWSFDAVQASRVYPAPKISPGSEDLTAERNEHG